jgi:subtilisin-like proprotein convertase family protein
MLGTLHLNRLVVLITTVLFAFSAAGNESPALIWENNKSFPYWTVAGESAYPSQGNKASPRLLVSLDESMLSTQLALKSSKAAKQNIVYFPNSSGEMIAFDVKEKSNFSPVLAAKYPEIKAYVGVGIDNSSLQVRFSLAPSGIDASINSSVELKSTAIEKVRGTELYLISSNLEPHDEHSGFSCSTEAKPITKSFKQILNASASGIMSDGAASGTSLSRTSFANTNTLSKYRLAVSTNGQYTRYHGGTVAGALAGINATLTHVNAIFERDFGVTLELIANNDLIIYTDPATDPYSDSTGPLIGELQTNIDIVIGSANYDHGHIFSALQCGNGGCGNAGIIGGFCNDLYKGGAWSDSLQPEGSNFTKLVAHEIGHQVGANHTFSNRSEGTGKNVEPGSGTTVMSYAGITGSNNVAVQGDEYFHYVSIEQTLAYLQNQSCHVDTPNENNLPVVEDIPDRTVPILTPYILSGSATDEDIEDVLSYTWEQIDDGVVTDTSFGPKNLSGANFRSLPPSGTGERYMPKLSSVFSGNLTLENPSTLSTWETLSSVPRDLNFGFTARDNAIGGGGVAQKSMKVSVVDLDGAFRITSPADGLMYLANETHTVSWSVAGTDLDPMLADKVTITLSVDGGYTYPYTLASDVENDGSHVVVMPDFVTTDARVRIQPNNNNIFYAINNQGFTLTRKDIIVSTEQYDYTVCSAQSTVASLTYVTSSEYSDIAVLSASNLPAALSVGFSPESVSIDGTAIDATIAAGANILAGTYPIKINVTSDSRSQSLPLSVRAYASNFTPIKLLTPSNNSLIERLRTTLTWKADINAELYRIEVSTEESFSEVFYSSITAETFSDITNLQLNTKYYWRVSPLNRCSDGISGDVHSFTTFDLTIAEDVPVIIPEDDGTGFYTSTITISKDQRITDVNVFLDMTVNEVYVLTATLTSPNNTEVELFHYACAWDADILAIFDDEADAFSCDSGSVPVLSGRLKPQSDALSRFNDQSTKGDWVLTIEDWSNPNIDIGTINNFGLQITTETGIEFENYPPIAFDQSLTAAAGEEIVISLRGADPEGSALAYQLISAADGRLSKFYSEKIGEFTKLNQMSPIYDGYAGLLEMALFNEGKYAVASGDRGLYTLDISDPTNILVLSTFEGYHRAATVSDDGTKVFAAASTEGLKTYDVSDPTNITLLGVYDTPNFAMSVTLSKDENTAFVSDRSSELQIINVSDPTNPTLLSTFSGNWGAYSDGVLSSDGNTLYLVNWFTLDIVDVSDPSSPQLLGRTSTQIDQYGNRVGGYSDALVLSNDGKVAYVESTAYGLIIVDISDSTSPSVVGSLDLDISNSPGGASKLALSPDGTTIYFAGDTTDLKVIDVKRPGTPVLVSTYQTTSLSWGVTTSAVGDMLYISQTPRQNQKADSSGVVLEILDIKKKAVTAGDIVNSNLYFASAAEASGYDRFNFRVNDGALDSAEATISVFITDSIYNDGTWTYTETSDNTIMITGCVGPCASALVIPEKINGSDVVAISNGAFAESGITSVQLPDTIIKIENYAFYKNSLKLLTLGANVTDIGAESFSYNNISIVSFLGNRPSIGRDAFKVNRGLEVISYCPDKSDWPGAGISNGASTIIPIEDCNAAIASKTSLIKIEAAALNSDTANLTLADLEAIRILNEIDPSYIDQYLTFIRLSSVIGNVSDIQRIISSVNSVMTECPTSARFVSVGGANPWPDQISWSLMGNDPDIPLLSGGVEFVLFTCLGDGRYRLNMYDSYGDGWLGRQKQVDTFFSILAVDGTELAKEGLASGFVGVANIRLGQYSNEAPSASNQSIEVIRGLPTAITLAAQDGDLDPLTRRLTSAPNSGSLYRSISWTRNSTYVSEGKAYGFALSDDENIGYVADGNTGLTIIDLQTKPLTALASLDTNGLTRSVKLSKDGRTAFLADGTLGLKVIDVSDSLNPTILSSITVGESVYDIALSDDGNKAFVAHLSGFSWVDVSNLDNPTLVTTVATPGDAQSIALSPNNERAYVGDGFKGFQVIDVSHPSVLKVLSSMDTDGEVNSIALSSDSSILYVADGSFGLKIFNVEISNSPALIASITGIGFVRSVELSNDGFTAYLATSQSAGPRVVNITDPYTPILMASSDDRSVNYVIPSLDETKAFAIISTGLESLDVGYKDPFSVGDTLLEAPIYLSYDSDAVGDTFEFVVNDGIVDSGNAQVIITILDDTDGDRVADDEDAFPNDSTESIDTDGDSIGNNSDSDDDNDGVLDSSDLFPLDVNEAYDTDLDGIGNNADTDDDGDGVLDGSDAFPLDATEWLDSDLDGVGNNADTDDDNDGVPDTSDAFPLDASESADTDGDGIGNNADSDDDGDGYTDTEETAAGTDPLSANSTPRSGLPIWLLKAAKDKMEQDATN